MLNLFLLNLKIIIDFNYNFFLQIYVDNICKDGCAGSAAGEDSSYDSDYEVDPPGKHQDVSRTTSDTLAAEYAEYVQSTPENPAGLVGDSSPGYTAR